MARNDKELAGLFGGKSKLPAWLRLSIFGTVIALAWVLAWELGLFLVLLISGGYVVWSWMREKGNIVDSLANWIFLIALLATPLALAINATADGFKGFGPAIVGAVQKRWNESRPPTVDVKVNEPVPTTTAPPPPPVQAAAQGPR